MQEYDNRFSQEVQNVPQKSRISSKHCEMSNAAGPDCSRKMIIIVEHSSL